MFSENCDVKRVQMAVLATLKQLDEVCKKNGLTYFVCGGTLIGTIREKGFIQWDDDIDVMMPRKDYECMIRNGKELFDKPYFICDYRGDFDREVTKVHAVLYNTNIRILDKNSNNIKKRYSFIDIFPIDGMPKGNIKKYIHYYHAFFWKIIYQLSRYDDIVNQYKENRKLLERVLMFILNKIKFRPKWNPIKILAKWHKVLSKYDYDNSDKVCSLTGPCEKKEILQKEWFSKTLRMPFEDIEVNVPCGYDAELRQYYGDYMTPPQKTEERELHHRMEIIGGE
jgi:lipopolysaccharide cholinephosphotransferase